MNNKMFSTRLKLAREKKGIGLKELRELVGVSQSAMSHYSTGATLPPLDVASKIADNLGVSLGWLCGKSEIRRFEYSTYGDIARAILSVLKEFDKSKARFSTEVIDNSGEDYSDILPSFETLVFIDDEKLYSFFERAGKYYEMSRGNDDEQELYEAWIEKQLAALDKDLTPKALESLPF